MYGEIVIRANGTSWTGSFFSHPVVSGGTRFRPRRPSGLRRRLRRWGIDHFDPVKNLWLLDGQDIDHNKTA
jgi:hypothetical protein